MAVTTPRATYRTLDEQAGRLTPAEERFERGRRTIGLFFGPLVFVLLVALPLDLEQTQQTLAAILSLVIVWWITEAIPIPVTALVGVALCVLLGVGTADDVFAAFSDSTIFLFIGGFVIAQAMTVHGLDRRFAFGVLSLPRVGQSTTGIIVAFAVIGAVTSPFMSNTAAAAMMLPIALGVMSTVGGMVAKQTPGEHDPERLRFGAALMLVITYSITVGGLLLPIGSPPNLIGREFIEEETGEPITFVEWFLTAAPIVLVMFVLVVAVVLLLNRPEVRRVQGAEEYIAEERRKLGRLSRGELNTLIALGLALALWFAPGFIGLVAGDDSDIYSSFSDHADEGVVAILAAALLFVLPLSWKERRFTLSWNEAVLIDWGTILLFGGGIVLGSLMDDTGLAKVIGESLADALGVSSLISITIVSVIVAVLISETTSNTASAAIVVPIAIALSTSAGVDPVIPALAAIFGANYGFMLPVSTPPNAIVYSSGMLPITRMVRAGAVFDVAGAVLCVVGVALMAKAVGLA
jgi:solute carrier family 13 (sodium-dependent dicarboxylate transporter), member 2/3/5